jgi:hypothetical protein
MKTLHPKISEIVSSSCNLSLIISLSDITKSPIIVFDNKSSFISFSSPPKAFSKAL